MQKSLVIGTIHDLWETEKDTTGSSGKSINCPVCKAPVLGVSAPLSNTMGTELYRSLLSVLHSSESVLA